MINLKLQLTLLLTPSLTWLGIPDDDQHSHHTKLVIAHLLYYAKREILMNWSSSTPPVVSSWEAMVDAALPMYKLTYINQGCPWKSDKVWSP